MEPDAAIPQEPRRRPAHGHPITGFFHLVFKAVCVVYWFLAPAKFITDFIVLVVLLAADFWTVKNVSGRLLVGLRWWNDVTEEGNGWRFESIDESTRRINPTDRFVFWAGLVGFLAWWVIAFFLTLVQPEDWIWLLIVVIAMALSISNLYAYFKCSKDARDFMGTYAQSAINAATTSAATAAVAATTSGSGRKPLASP